MNIMRIVALLTCVTTQISHVALYGTKANPDELYAADDMPRRLIIRPRDFIWDTVQVRRLLALHLVSQSIDIDEVDRDGDTALMFAVSTGNIEHVRRLIAVQAKLNKKDMLGRTALIIAVIEGYPTIVALLIQAQADLNIRNPAGWSALACGVLGNRKASVKLLLDAGADPFLRASIAGSPPRTAAGIARDCGNDEIAALLEEAESRWYKSTLDALVMEDWDTSDEEEMKETKEQST